jgi:hypothetical protein
MPTQSLEAIQRRIAQQDSELQALRRELAARQTKLKSLKQRKQSLREQLQKVEAEIAAVANGTRGGVQPPPKSSKKHVSKAAVARKAGQPTLAQLIGVVLREAGKPMSVLQLTQGVKRKGFKTTSKNPYKLVGKTVYTMAAKGTLRRAPDQSGFMAPTSGNGKAVPQAKSAGPKPKSKATPAANGVAKATTGAKRSQQTPLRQLLEQILHRNNKPMTGGELAAEVVKAGYKSKSKHLADNVWTALGNMKNVENIKGQGYRLKQGK